jgi:uncharacterized protein YigA (DUF484 family)
MQPVDTPAIVYCGEAIKRWRSQAIDENSQVGSVALRLLSHDIVTPKGVLLLAVCDASATREDL